jgi:hypothetical protein
MPTTPAKAPRRAPRAPALSPNERPENCSIDGNPAQAKSKPLAQAGKPRQCYETSPPLQNTRDLPIFRVGKVTLRVRREETPN